MKNTYCKLCLFSSKTTDERNCEFDIPYLIKDLKRIETRDEYNYIHNYECQYGLDKNILNNIEIKDMSHDEITTYILNKKLISYYLLIDVRSIQNNIQELISQINNLDIKPKFVSLVIKASDNIDQFISSIKNGLHDGIVWKIHNFIEDIELEKILNVILDTNAYANGTKIFYIYTPDTNDLATMSLNNNINFMQYASILEQRDCSGFCMAMDTLNGLALPFNIFKEFYSCKYKSILKPIQQLNLIKYETL